MDATFYNKLDGIAVGTRRSHSERSRRPHFLVRFRWDHAPTAKLLTKEQNVPTQPAGRSTTRRDGGELRHARFPMRLSLIIGLVMWIGKTTAYFMTHSAAIFSDAPESVVHVV